MTTTVCLFTEPDTEGCDATVMYGHTNWINFRMQHGPVDAVVGSPSTPAQMSDFVDAVLILSPRVIVMDIPRNTTWFAEGIQFHNTMKSFINIGYRMNNRAIGRGESRRLYISGVREEIARTRGHGVRWPFSRWKRNHQPTNALRQIVEVNL